METFNYNLSTMKRGPVLSKDAKVLKEFKLEMEVVSWIREESEIRDVEKDMIVNQILKEAMLANNHKKSIENLVNNPEGAIK